jgi:chorismate mutase
MTLEQKRRDIDQIDGEILALLGRRAGIVREIEMKLKAGLPIVDWAREAEIIRRAAQHGGGPLADDAADRIYRAILREARQIELELSQSAVRVHGLTV